MERVLVRFVLGVACVGLASCRQAPRTNYTALETDEMMSQIPSCHYGDPNISDCLRRAVELARPVLARGAPALGVQPLDPLRVPNVRLRHHNAPAQGFKYDAWFSDVTISGLADFTVNTLDVYPDQLKVVANVSLPQLRMGGEFVVLGHFQMLPVESTGKMAANFTSCTAGVEALGARVHRRMLVRDATVHLRCDGPLKADLTEAHSASGDMEKITDHIVTMHSSDIVSSIQPAVETTLAMVLEDVANKFLKNVPYDMVFAE